MKILLLGDASNYHNALASGLTALGHDVTLASAGSRWMNTRRDIDISRRPGKIGGAMLWLKLSTVLASDLKGYDVVQLVSPGFAELRPVRLEKLFRRLRRDNGHVYLTALGTDASLVRNFLSPHPAVAYSELHSPAGRSPWSFSAEAECDKWLAPHLVAYTDMLYNSVDGVVSALYEYHRIVEAEYPGVPLAYGGIPIDLSSLPEKTPAADGPLRILFAAHRGREAMKGADRLLPVLEQLGREGKAQIIRPENVPYADFLKLLADCDIVSDQLYSYTPATTALLAMAMGTVPISGGEEDYYRFIGEAELRPIINASPTDLDGLAEQLRRLAADREALRRMSDQGRLFVERHNEARVVARRFVDFWTR